MDFPDQFPEVTDFHCFIISPHASWKVVDRFIFLKNKKKYNILLYFTACAPQQKWPLRIQNKENIFKIGLIPI